MRTATESNGLKPLLARHLLLLLAAALLAAVVAFVATAEVAQAQTTGQCVDEASGRRNNCTANDVSLTRYEVLSGPSSCVPGSTVDVTLMAVLDSTTAQQRYDIGLFVGLGGENAKTATGANSCYRDFLSPNSQTGPWDLTGGFGPFRELETGNRADACGDIQANVTNFRQLQPLSLLCEDEDGNGYLDVSTCVTWDNQSVNDTCEGVLDTVPSTPSKCNCGPVQVGDIALGAYAWLTVEPDDVNRVDEQHVFTITAVADGPGPMPLWADITPFVSPSSALVSHNCGVIPFSSPPPPVTARCQVTVTSGVVGTVVVTATAMYVYSDHILDVFSDDERGDADDGVKEYVDAEIEISPDGTLVNGVGISHTFQITVTGFGPTPVESLVITPSVTPQTYDQYSTTCGDFPVDVATAVNTCTVSFVSETLEEHDVSATALITFTSENGSTTFELDHAVASDRPTGAEPVTKRFADLNITIAPGTATNPVGQPHAFTVTVFTRTIEAGSVVTYPVQGAFPVVSVSPPPDGGITGNDCDAPDGTGIGGQCTFTITSSAPGVFTANAAVTVTVGNTGDVLTADTATESGPAGSGPATKTYEAGYIVVDKVTNPAGSAQLFAFDPSWSDTNFSLADATTPYNSGPLPPGAYSVTETVPSGWDLTGAVCVNGAGAEQAPNAITLEASATVTCTFYNTQRGNIVINKNTIGGDGSFDYTSTGGLVPANFTLTTVGGVGSTGTAYNNVLPGSYTVIEQPETGWDRTALTCVDPSGGTVVNVGVGQANIALAPGETVSCTYVNTQRGSIQIEKQTSPDGSTQSFSFTGAIITSLQDGQQSSIVSVPPGQYTVTEGGVSGWDLTGISCNDGGSAVPSTGDLATRTATFNVAAGEAVLCTFENTQQGTLIVIKVTDPPGANVSFAFTSTVPGSESFSLTGVPPVANTRVMTVTPGTYAVAEQTPAGWELTDVVCSNEDPSDAIDVEAGETVSCVFLNTQRATVIINKVTIPAGSTQSFAFTSTLPGGNFSLTGAAPNNSRTETNVPPGFYTVEESVPPGWDLTGISENCLSESPGVGPNAASIFVLPGATVSCTFTNTQWGSIQVAKVTEPVDSTQVFTFAGDIDALLQGGQQSAVVPVPPGQYAVAEELLDGWDLTSIDCTDPTGDSTGTPAKGVATFNVEPGEAVRCVFTNVQRGRILVDKVTQPAGSAQSFNFALTPPSGPVVNFALTDAAAPFDSGPVVPGTYAVAETPVGGWRTTSTCTSSLGGTENPAAISLQPGETVTCVFTNVQLGTVIINKVTDPAGSTQSFPFVTTVPGGNFSLTGAAPNNSRTVGNVAPGTYSVTESVPAGWALTDSSCSDGSPVNAIVLGPGETVTCTFFNQQRAIIVVEKQTLPDGDDTTFTFSGDLEGTIGDGQRITRTVVPLRPYSVSELVPEGWVLTSITPAGCLEQAAPTGAIGEEPLEPTAFFFPAPGET